MARRHWFAGDRSVDVVNASVMIEALWPVLDPDLGGNGRGRHAPI
jgi:hypothetical protein